MTERCPQPEGLSRGERPTGGRPRCQLQIHDWVESRADDGRDVEGAETGAGALEIVVDGTSYVYDPGSGRPNQVIGPVSAERITVAPDGAQDLRTGLDEQIGAPVRRDRLPITNDELRFVARVVAESWTSGGQ